MVATKVTYEAHGYGVELRENPLLGQPIPERDPYDDVSEREWRRAYEAPFVVEAWFPDGTWRVDYLDSIEAAREALWYWAGNAWDWVHLGPVDDTCPQCGHRMACNECRYRYG